MASAFDSAGQRCSALRVLCVQEEAADRVLEMLRGAMAELRMGDPARLLTDVGPVIDAEAKANIDRHIATMRSKGRKVYQRVHASSAPTDTGTFVPPTLIELDSLADLQREVFGPVLHFVRYRRDDLDALLEQINATGYGLTLGVHTRIDETIARVVAPGAGGQRLRQPQHGGRGGGCAALRRRRPVGHRAEGRRARCTCTACCRAARATCVARALAMTPDPAAQAAAADQPADAPPVERGVDALRWMRCGSGRQAPGTTRWWRPASASPGRAARVPHANCAARPANATSTALLPREAVLCLAADDADRLVQLAAVLAVGSHAVWPAAASALRDSLPRDLAGHIVLTPDWMSAQPAFDAVLLHGDAAALHAVSAQLARRDGAIVGVQRLAPGETDIALERLLIERALSVNTAAAGGNASLMTIG